jgi:polar amino acid transport system substrate-binding protein
MLGLVGLTWTGTALAQQEDDLAKARAAGKLRVGTSADYPPFEFYDSNFRLDGFDVALAAELGKRLGVQVEFYDFAFPGLLDALRLGQVDAAISAISVTPERQAIVDFSNLYYIAEDGVLMRANTTNTIRGPGDFAGLKVGVERGTTYQSWAQQNLVDTGIIAQTDLVSYEDTNALVRDLTNGTIDAGLVGLLPARIAASRLPELRVAGSNLNLQRLAVAVRKGSTLTDALNEALLAMQTDGTFAALVEQYLQVAASSVTPDQNEAAVENLPVPKGGGNVATPPCIHGMAYVADLNLDDNNMTTPAVMAPGQQFSKSWRVRNSGTCAWAPDFQLVYVNGNRPEAQMGGQPVSVGRAVAPGETVDLTVNLVAPTNPGVYQGFWQMRDNTGKLFGQVVWVGIQVPNPNPPTATPQPPAPPTAVPAPSVPNPNLRADSTYITAGQCTTIRWDVDNVSAVYFIDGGNQQGVGGHDARTVCPTVTTTYVLRVVQRNGAAIDYPITINVSGAPPPPSRPSPRVAEFSASSNNIQQGQCVLFRWRTENADGVNLYRSGGAILNAGSPNGEHQDCPPAGYQDYRLDAYGNGHDYRNIGVQVNQVNAGGGGGSGGGPPRDE